MEGLRDATNGTGGPVQLPSPLLSPVLESPSPSLEASNDLDESPDPHSHDRKISDVLSKASIAIEKEVASAAAAASQNGHNSSSKSPVALQARRKSSVKSLASPNSDVSDRERNLKLSPKQIQELTEEPDSLPLRAVTEIPDLTLPSPPDGVGRARDGSTEGVEKGGVQHENRKEVSGVAKSDTGQGSNGASAKKAGENERLRALSDTQKGSRPGMNSRTVSTPPMIQRKQSSSTSKRNSTSRHESFSRDSRPNRLPPLQLNEKPNGTGTSSLKPLMMNTEPVASPMPPSIPLPPMSIPTYLQLELAADRPSPLYIYRPSTTDFPYESARIKYERLLNFLLLPPQLEQTILFGFFACLDAWLYTFTILPLRFFRAIYILGGWMIRTLVKEIKEISSFTIEGIGRLWHRRRAGDTSAPPTPALGSRRPSAIAMNLRNERSPLQENASRDQKLQEALRKYARNSAFRHRRTKSTPSLLMPTHKADMLKGLMVIITCVVLMRLDASRMYHGIRGQAAIKLYVIYNVLEVCDRLFSALGQDILECLFSREVLERNPDGRSKVLRPFWMFLLALAYNIIHSTALFYQVITLNVAVNSYSNALLTLLMSNQFVEIKGTVFKKFEKENLFQMTCADVVERFQLSLMLSIIVLRNIFEFGGLSMGAASGIAGSNTAGTLFKGSSIIPKSFTIFPQINAQVFTPFLLVIGSECLVDWLKHAYITKFNNTKPAVYGRFLDILAKDYYSNAFADQNLTKRLGLPVLPLSCLFIRAMVQIYRMFIETHMPLPIPSPATSLSDSPPSTSSPATTAALAHIDLLFRRALGRSSFTSSSTTSPFPASLSSLTLPALDTLITASTSLLLLLLTYTLLLSLKLLLGMTLLHFSRSRYRKMKEAEHVIVDTGGKRVGGWGVVEVDDDKKRWIHEGDREGLGRSLERGRKEEGKAGDEGWSGRELQGVWRYSMIAKRIW